ncbi:mannosyl-oligosaccharide 1,2-alpha-mannosidase IB, putative [Trypanosoma brucei brucei TREU927]|uniref:alpha-1,2-Mannosidase n=1 Tax=Trypanosoma brucei brucei (strain 927/4 GUTat10.1) TaxID=185431 RepID=Q57W81_TRYB2|nr:mannosyl-oligosaccharide 1,2-alpha-mannosidase IB, putative [Trypanosoma brucei brucei TREU927]AAX70138.1 mannosyl-oligosaccharide 1,2-alpha-mannosidase IB, putative [Trypanosoma brucei]AAZ13057.1 mannosyl-oligosaccharide 1,2-alpha-mannosidase IB, putative [Trypanosoma brucei brucei TREU927]
MKGAQFLKMPCVRVLLVLVRVFFVHLPSFAFGDAFPVNGARGGNSQGYNTDGMHPIQAEMLPYVRDMIDHAFGSYIKYAFPKDELCPVSGTGKNTMGGYGWTLIDSLDTLAIAGFHKEFRRHAKWVEEHLTFDIDESVSVFETTIRALGGLLAAHFMYEEGIVPIIPSEHDYNGGFLRLAVDLADRLMPCFDTPTGIPYGKVNLRRGVSGGESQLANTAGSGTLLVEMTVLSRITGDGKYERAARRASEALFAARDSQTELMGTYVSVSSGGFSSSESSVGSGLDSAIEYFIKSHSMSGDIGDWERFERTARAVNRYVRKGGMLLAASMYSGRRLQTSQESLSSFFPGNLVLGGHLHEAVESSWPIHTFFKHFGVLPEIFSLESGEPSWRSHDYIGRPEHIESLYMLYRATRDPTYLLMGKELALAINLRMRTPYGFSSVSDVRYPHHDGVHRDSMESFMIAETLKYLYLLFDECNAVHVQGRMGGRASPHCVMDSGSGSSVSHVGWVFNTEAHLFPNSAEWWAPTSLETLDKEAEDPAAALRRQRLEVIDGLLASFEEVDGEVVGANDKGGAALYQFHCANHALSDVGRLSKSVFR